ncbi:hypothetical protein F6X40_34495 [Paraburkholderia sp. UCT31]|uniref:hypothetical protein n=1 Tax=Paraburkholderia sp. UCT31 TaxID=2615209 RepID=UPI00165529B8|nr:hypothetical protein [Paraburkholderia sp. UCT31]MBC8741673.1 hypothetical protein [Paraburkholderia sp. UCT31]
MISNPLLTVRSSGDFVLGVPGRLPTERLLCGHRQIGEPHWPSLLDAVLSFVRDGTETLFDTHVVQRRILANRFVLT